MWESKQNKHSVCYAVYVKKLNGNRMQNKDNIWGQEGEWLFVHENLQLMEEA